MRKAVLLILMGLLFAAAPARAGQAEAREVARINNCTPKKIEVVSSRLTQASQTIYRVECNMPKISDSGSASLADAVLIRCDGSMCDMLRAVSKDSK